MSGMMMLTNQPKPVKTLSATVRAKWRMTVCCGEIDRTTSHMTYAVKNAFRATIGHAVMFQWNGRIPR